MHTQSSNSAFEPDNVGATPSPATRPPVYVGSELFRRAAFGDNHPLAIIRHAAVFDLVEILGWLDGSSFREAREATPEQLLEFHDPDYLEALQYAESEGRVTPEARQRFNIGTLENPVFPGLFERASTTVGGSILAAELALDGHVAFHPSGGTHHGRPERASGFCYFNDPVFAIRTLLSHGRERVTYVDLDAHHGDGVEDAFIDDPRVQTISIHEADRWPYSGADATSRDGNARNLPVPAGLNDSELDYLMQNAVLPLCASFDTDALMLCCGADSLAGDPLAKMRLSNVALWQAVDQLIALEQPTVVLGGGGYNPWTLTRYWAGLWGRIAGFTLPERLPAAAERMFRGMECDLVDDDDVDERWFTTMADSPYPGNLRDTIRWLADAAVAA